MFIREMKVNFKSFLIWMSVLLGMLLLVFLMYPFIIKSENIQMMNEMMELFPPELLKAFNMDISSIDSAFGWLKSEGFLFILLITGCYAGLLGANILVKEENDKTIEYLNSLPIKRTSIVLNKVISSLIYISLMILIVFIFNFVGLLTGGDFDKKQYILLGITPFFSSFVIFFLCMFLSTFTHKSKRMTGVTFGIVLMSYILVMFSQIADSVEFLKYFSVFTLADIRNILLDNSINPIMVCISIVLSALFLSLVTYRYRKKELI